MSIFSRLPEANLQSHMSSDTDMTDMIDVNCGICNRKFIVPIANDYPDTCENVFCNKAKKALETYINGTSYFYK